MAKQALRTKRAKKTESDTSALAVGARLRSVREAAGLSQRELAKRAGVTSATISLVEQDSHAPSLASLHRILNAIPISMAEFFALPASRQDALFYEKGDLAVVSRGSAYDLYLTRAIRQATLERVPTSGAVVSEFMKRNLEVAAGVKQQLEMDARNTPGVRLLPGRFMVINQAMASQKGKEAGAKFVRDFIEDAKASGFVAQALARHNIQGAAVAPAGDAQQ